LSVLHPVDVVCSADEWLENTGPSCDWDCRQRRRVTRQVEEFFAPLGIAIKTIRKCVLGANLDKCKTERGGCLLKVLDALRS
jgi:hypothetical protein